MDTEHQESPQEINHRLYGSERKGAKHHSDEEKALALSVYAETGSTSTAAEETGIPATTIHSWVSRDPDIDSKLEAMRRALRERLAHKYASIAYESAEALLDRVRNGDYRVEKNGEITRVPIPGRELAFITSVAGDKHALLTGTMQKQRGEDQALGNLADKLIKALDRRRIEGRAVDASYPQEGAQETGDSVSIIPEGNDK